MEAVPIKFGTDGWRGRIAAKWTMIAFGVLILAYFGSRFVTSIILS